MAVPLIFDLDGTLVDSSSGILTSLSWAFTRLNLTPALELTPSIIGPPLYETLKILSPHSDAKVLDDLAVVFKQHYDDVGFKETHAFSGVQEMLKVLSLCEGIELHIATNKRKKPTSRIISRLDWSHYFCSILSPDSLSPTLPDKASMLTEIMLRSNCNGGNSLYVGDRIDDYKAALASNMSFVFAAWGFEDNAANLNHDVVKADTPNATLLLDCLNY